MTTPEPDRFEFTTLAHRDLRILNPLSDAAVDHALSLLPLASGDPVLDVGCGKGEMLLRLVERRGVRAVGVDPNPRFVEEARRAAAARAPSGDVVIHCADVADVPLDDSSFAAALCVGATHAFGGLRPALAALSRLVRPGGSIVVGEGFWRRRPDPEYLAFLGNAEGDLSDHAGNLAAGAAAGLSPVHSSVASDDDWDRYEDAYAAAVESHVGADPRGPASPGAAAALRRIRAWRAAYLRWGRDTLGFGLYVFRR